MLEVEDLVKVEGTNRVVHVLFRGRDKVQLKRVEEGANWGRGGRTVALENIVANLTERG